MKVRHFINNTSAGILIGWISAGGFVAFGYAAPSGFMSDYGATIITTVGALLGAALATAAVLAQIEAQRDAEERQRSRAQRAAKAMLPIALSQLFEVAKAGAAAHYHECESTKGRATWDEAVSTINAPPDAFDTIRACIAQADHGDADRLANLLRYYQVLRARAERRNRHLINLRDDDARNAVQWAIFARLIEDCFEYAREMADNIPPTLTARDFSSNLPLRGYHTTADSPLPAALHRAVDAENPELFSCAPPLPS